MRGLSYHQRPRSLGAQVARMGARWPQFAFRRRNSMVSWRGPLRGFQKEYRVEVLWDIQGAAKPYVYLQEPTLQPREGGTFGEIPHLIFYSEHPELSGLCLFDPDGSEWSNKLLIADTTIVWAAEWLLYYELWHIDGVWRGGGVGPESIAEARAAAVYRTAGELYRDSPGASAVAG